MGEDRPMQNETVDPTLTALLDIDRAVRSLYTAWPALARFPDYIADMLGDIARRQADQSLQFENLMERIEALKARRAVFAPSVAGLPGMGGADADRS